MPQTDRIGHGTKLQRSDDGTANGNFASVGTIRDITPPSVTRDAVQSTHQESLERWHEFIGGMKDGGELEFAMTFDPASAETIAFLNDLNANTTGFYKVVYPDATEWGFSGLVTAISPETPVEEKMEASVTIKLSGKPGFVA